MKQTAVEWLVEQFEKQIEKSAKNELETNRSSDYRIGLKKAIDFCEQAKEIEKQGYSLEDLKEAFAMGRTNATIKDFNQTFKNK